MNLYGILKTSLQRSDLSKITSADITEVIPLSTEHVKIPEPFNLEFYEDQVNKLWTDGLFRDFEINLTPKDVELAKKEPLDWFLYLGSKAYPCTLKINTIESNALKYIEALSLQRKYHGIYTDLIIKLSEGYGFVMRFSLNEHFSNLGGTQKSMKDLMEIPAIISFTKDNERMIKFSNNSSSLNLYKQNYYSIYRYGKNDDEIKIWSYDHAFGNSAYVLNGSISRSFISDFTLLLDRYKKMAKKVE